YSRKSRRNYGQGTLVMLGRLRLSRLAPNSFAPVYSDLGQGLLQLGCAFLGYLGAHQAYPPELAKPKKVLQTRIRDLGVAQAEIFKFAQGLDMHQARVRDLGPAQTKPE